MEYQEIKVKILEDGTVEVDVDGVKGKKCLEITRQIEEALGGDVIERKLKTAYYDSDDKEDDNLLTSWN